MLKSNKREGKSDAHNPYLCMNLVLSEMCLTVSGHNFP